MTRYPEFASASDSRVRLSARAGISMLSPSNGDGVTHDGIREAPAERHLGGEQTLLKRLPLGFGHQGRQGQIAQPLTRCEQHLAVAIGDQGPGIDRSRADELRTSKRMRR